MRKSVVVLFLILVISLITLQAASKRSRTADPSIQIPGVAINAMQKIDPERIRAHVRFLSHDLLEGRGTGQRGGDIAAEYIATQFAPDGLQPAGDNGTFLQKVPMVGITRRLWHRGAGIRLGRLQRRGRQRQGPAHARQ